MRERMRERERERERERVRQTEQKDERRETMEAEETRRKAKYRKYDCRSVVNVWPVAPILYIGLALLDSSCS
jgi:hypothetical protein